MACPTSSAILERVRALPGVTAVGSIQHLPMTGYNWTAQTYRADRPPLQGQTAPSAVWRFIGWDYFAAMGIHAARGPRVHRRRTPRQRRPWRSSTKRSRAASSATFRAPIGQRLVSVSGRGKDEPEIVGVVSDVRFQSLDKPGEPEIYRPLAQTFMFPMGFVVRTDGPPAQLVAAVRQAAYDVDPAIPVGDLQPLSSLVAGTLGRPRLLALLLSVFAGIGLVLGVVGVYGVVAYRVRQQEREFGIRLALGARPDRVLTTVLAQGAGYAAAGLAIGLPAAFALARLMDSVIFGITSHDAVTLRRTAGHRRGRDHRGHTAPGTTSGAGRPSADDARVGVGSRPPAARSSRRLRRLLGLGASPLAGPRPFGRGSGARVER